TPPGGTPQPVYGIVISDPPTIDYASINFVFRNSGPVGTSEIWGSTMPTVTLLLDPSGTSGVQLITSGGSSGQPGDLPEPMKLVRNGKLVTSCSGNAPGPSATLVQPHGVYQFSEPSQGPL